MNIQNLPPMEIEKESFRIITEELGARVGNTLRVLRDHWLTAPTPKGTGCPSWPRSLSAPLILASPASGPHPQTTPTLLAPHSALVFSG